MPPIKPAHHSSSSAFEEKLHGLQGRAYWRSFDELAQTPEFEHYVKNEFPQTAGFWDEPISRRSFLKVMGASFGALLFAGCRRPIERIIPYNQQPEEIIPGKPLYFASTHLHQGYGRGVLVETHTGRPTKIEGNPEHPDSLGAADVFMLASVLQLYDPDRAQAVTLNGAEQTWDDFLLALYQLLDEHEKRRGAGLRLLTGTVTSPALRDQMRALQKRFPEARWHAYEPLSRDAIYAGARLAFGEAAEPVYRIEPASVIVALDADFLFGMPGSLSYARAYGNRRRRTEALNRLYAVEPTPTITGMTADHRLPLRGDRIEALAHALASALGIAEAHDLSGELPSQAQAWLSAAAKDLRENAGAGLVLAGESQPAAVHALAHAINHRLGNVGKTVIYVEPIAASPEPQTDSIQSLVQEMRAGHVETLVLIGGNPVYDAPADLNFADALGRVKTRIRLSLHADETAALCQWHIPESHPLESWGDARAHDGTVSFFQPEIAPLYQSKTAYELLSAMTEIAPRANHKVLQEYWLPRLEGADRELAWERALHDGIVPKTTAPAKPVGLRLRALPRPKAATGIELVFRPDPSVWDGRFANNAWLQELPKPTTTLTWDNAAYISPQLAARLGVTNQDVIEIQAGGRSIEAPVWMVPGQNENTISITLGYGRTHGGHVADGAGTNAYPLRTLDALWSLPAISVRKTGQQIKLATTQHHFLMEGRELVRAAAIDEFKRNPAFAQRPWENPTHDERLYNYDEPKASAEYAWAMTIDLNTCIGCNACVTACQSENNIPVVGKDEVLRGREMHWIRVDRYFEGGPDNPRQYSQPVPCMHCEDAPCEVVCPVGATLHSDEGLNQMVYNRCVGTRYCSNNCPYKVRRFNFFHWTEYVKGPLTLAQNPDVTVRSRGVMEKCTYCIQRINAVKIKAEEEGRSARDGEIVPACAQACPTKTIVFGNLLDKDSAVSRQRADVRSYGLLSELGTRPRTTYLAKLLNPNAEADHGA